MPATTDRQVTGNHVAPGGLSPRPQPSLLFHVRPEGELLLHCAREHLREAARVAELASTLLDWDLVFRLAIRHGTLPRLYRHLASTCAGLVPPDALTRIRAQYEYNSMRNLSQTRELIRMLRALESDRIEALAYKGPTLAEHAYGSLALRQFGDLDLLVRPGDARRATAVLADMGYAGDPWPDDPDYLGRSHVRALHHPNGVEVELHWAFLPHEFSFNADLDAWWKRMQRRPFGGTMVRALPAEELLLVLCVHGCRHVWVRLKGVCDVAALVGRETQLDWDQTFRVAKASGGQRMLALGLALARDLLGASLPPAVSNRIDAEPSVLALVRRVAERLFDDEMCQPASADAQLFYLRARERWRDKLSHGTRYVRRAAAEWRHGAPRPAANGNR